MQRLLTIVALITLGLALDGNRCMAADPLTVASNFEGASVRDVAIDNAARRISFMPAGTPSAAGRAGGTSA